MGERLIPITVEEWWHRVRSRPCRTASGGYWPSRFIETYEYQCRASEFLQPNVFLVRFTNREGSDTVSEGHPTATAITVVEFAKNPTFVQKLLTKPDGENPPWDKGLPILSAELLVHHCKGCNRLVVIDGVHRLVAIASRAIDAELYVTELLGEEWPQAMPDMRHICKCKNSIPAPAK
jgi:hypothetical protein